MYVFAPAWPFPCPRSLNHKESQEVILPGAHGKGWHDEKKRTDLRSVRCKDLFDAETLLEAIDASAGIHQLLLAGEERMALGADINLQLLLRAAGFKRLTAHAANDGLAVLGMDSFFLDFSPLSRMQ